MSSTLESVITGLPYFPNFHDGNTLEYDMFETKRGYYFSIELIAAKDKHIADIVYNFRIIDLSNLYGKKMTGSIVIFHKSRKNPTFSGNSEMYWAIVNAFYHTKASIEQNEEDFVLDANIDSRSICHEFTKEVRRNLRQVEESGFAVESLVRQ